MERISAAIRHDVEEVAAFGVQAEHELGAAVADISQMLLTAEPSEIDATSDNSNDVDVIMIDHILAGFIYGMTTEDHLTEIVACYTAATVDHELTKAIQDFNAGGWYNIAQGCL